MTTARDRLARLSLTLALALLLTTARTASAESTAHLLGSVTDAAGQPVAGAKVEMVHTKFGSKETFQSDKKGGFSRLGLKPGDWQVTVRAEGFADFSQVVHIGLGKSPLKVALTPQAAGGGSAAEFSLGGKKVSPEAAAAFARAQEALKAGAAADARSALAELIQLEPELSSPHFVLAQLEREAGEVDKARTTLKRGLELDPANALGWLALGELDGDAGNGADAIAAFRKALEIDPRSPAAHKKLGMALLAAADYAGAAKALETYLELQPEAADAEQKRQLLDECRKLAAK